jgi:hypothetical protein
LSQLALYQELALVAIIVHFICGSGGIRSRSQKESKTSLAGKKCVSTNNAFSFSSSRDAEKCRLAGEKREQLD